MATFLRLSLFFFWLAGPAVVFSLGEEKAQAAVLPKSVTISAGDYTKFVSETALSGWFLLETRIAPNYSRQNEIVNPAYCSTDAFGCEVALSRKTRGRLAVFLTREINEETLRQFVRELSGEANQEPVNARFGIN